MAHIYIIYIYHHSDHSLVNYNNVTTPNALQLGVASASASPLRRGPKPVRSLDGSTKQAESLGVGTRNEAVPFSRHAVRACIECRSVDGYMLYVHTSSKFICI